MKSQKSWFITGASKGLGLTLVKKLLAQGFQVAATSRTVDQLEKVIGEKSNQFLPLSMDLENEANVQEAIKQTTEHFGSLDVVVNNAGYGLVGSLEELSDEEVRGNFNVNVFGLLNVIRQALPQLRKQQSGHIFNISSIGGMSGDFAGFGSYCATKFAVVGLSEALAADVKSFGIKTTVVLPGYFRTNFLSAGSFVTPKQEIAAYQDVRDSQDQHQQQIDGNQPGDPEKAAEVLIQVAEMPEPPLHLLLGQDAYDLASNKLASLNAENEAWKDLIVSTNFQTEN